MPTGKHTAHINTTNVCEDCHSVVAFAPAVRVDHLQVLGACQTCHNGIIADGKIAGHPASGDSCDNCHTTNGWLPANFDHDNITGNCVSCHNGTDALGKDAGHAQTTDVCEDCHTVVAFSPVLAVDHTQVLGSCSSCHDGGIATGKASNHFVTTRQCDHCHATNGWVPLQFAHVSATYPGDHRRNLRCTDCHTGNTEILAWRFPAYQPECAACHANDWKSDPHRGATVSQLRDCSGACHRPAGEHRVTDSEF